MSSSSFHSRQALPGCGERVCVVLALVWLFGSGRVAEAQQSAAVPPVPPYRAPSLALVQPAGGGTVPQDRPVVVFRFAAGDSADPVDARSFVVSVDGKDRTPIFQVARDVASGPLSANPNEHGSAIALGAHQLAARICSIRGTCSEVSATVTVVTSAAVAADTRSSDRKRTLIDLLLAAARKLLAP